MAAPDSLSTALRLCARAAAGEVALICRDGSSLTYGEWDRRADVVATVLRERVRPGGTVIARLGDRSDALCAVALFAAVRAGCFVLPMSGRFTDQEVADAAGEHRVRLVLTDGDTEALPGLEVLRVDGVTGRADRAAPPTPGGAIVYTPGTAGPPAAIRWTHADLLTWLTGWTGAPMRRPHLHDFPLDGEHALGRLVRTLLRYPGVRSRTLEPHLLVADLNRHRPVDVLLVAASAKAVTDHGLEALSPEAAHAVLSVYLVYDFSREATIHRLRTALRRATVTNVYAVAEAGRGQIWKKYPPLADDPVREPAPPGGLSAVGDPIFGTAARITDARGNPLRAGSLGRIWLRPGLPSALSYCDGQGRPGVFHDGWVRTDDLGLVDEAGSLFLAGRAEDVTMVGDAWLSAHQIEQAVAAHVRVGDVAATWPAGSGAGDGPVVAVAPTPAADVATLEAELRELLVERFGGAAAKARIVTVPEVSRTYVGKVARRRLRATLGVPA